MSSVFSASLDGISSHNSICHAQPQFRRFGSGHGQPPNAKTSLQKPNNTYNNSQGITNGETLANLMESIVSSQTNPHSSAFFKRQEVFSNLPVYFRRWLATASDDEESDGPPPTADQEFMDTHNGHRRPTHERSCPFPEEPTCSSEGLDVAPLSEHPFYPDQLLEAELASFTSKYLNLDYGTPGPGDNTTEGETGSPFISSDTTTLTGTPGGVETPWEIGPTSVSLLDTTKFEFGVDANGSVSNDPWPWGSYVYQPSSPPVYFNPEEHLRERKIRKWEKKLRRRLTVIFDEEAVLTGRSVKPKRQKGKRRERRKAKEKGKEVEDENLPQITAFSGVIRGRTIYNP